MFVMKTIMTVDEDYCGECVSLLNQVLMCYLMW
jgi:hypothetical protein